VPDNLFNQNNELKKQEIFLFYISNIKCITMLRLSNVRRQNMNRRKCIGALIAASLVVGTKTAYANQNRLRIGLTPVILADQIAFLSRWGDYLTEQSGCNVSFVARESYQEILNLLLSDQIDAAWICGYPYIRYETELDLLSVPLYQNEPLYRAYLIQSNQPSANIHSWKDLKNKVLAYSDPLSNSGWLVAQAELVKAGLTTSDLKRSFFAHGHRNVAEAVAARLANAGSIDGYVWETMRKQGMGAIAKTSVVWQSEPYGFPPIVTKSKNSHPCRERLQKSLMGMTNDTIGRDLLNALNLSGFIGGSPDMFDSIRRLAQQVPKSGIGAS
jgi:phosphonate transport system substrate-binding protein